jgi:3-oxoadipate enol-lactonase/4-carboxymuconolactone decarboxylase
MNAVPVLSFVDFSGAAGRGLPLLLLGPSLGTSARNLWGSAAQALTEQFQVIGWDLPGHGDSAPDSGFDLVSLAKSVLAVADELVGAQGGAFHYAGDSVGGAVGLQLMLDAPARVASATLLCTGARIGEASAWRERAAVVRANGTEALIDATPTRWFAPGFAERDVATAEALLGDLSKADANSYATVCDALAAFDVRDRLLEIRTPIVAVAGACDVVCPPASLRHIANGVQHGLLVALDDVAHLAPVEAPAEVARLISEAAQYAVAAGQTRTVAQVRAAGMKVRREVLGDPHVDRASAIATEFTAEFQELITQYAWGSIWTRPGLDRRSRSLITLTALVARGHHEELAMHVRAARNNGLSNDEIMELLLQTAIYCGVPDANTAFRIAQQVLADLDSAPTTTSDPNRDPDPNSES